MDDILLNFSGLPYWAAAEGRPYEIIIQKIFYRTLERNESKKKGLP
jgi:hypothetical protein